MNCQLYSQVPLYYSLLGRGREGGRERERGREREGGRDRREGGRDKKTRKRKGD